MGQWKFHTPEGVMDYLPQECKKKRDLEAIIRSVFSKRGYDEIETPGFEFYDVYAGTTNFTLQENLFKFFDHKGRILCLRYDGTVPVARFAATVCKESKTPLRYSYLGNMYRFNESGGGRQREFTQAGVELLGCKSAEADAEIIATAIESAQALGIKDLQVSIGQVSFFKGLVTRWKLNEEQAEQLQYMIDARETVALDELISQLELPAGDKEILDLMTSADGNPDVIKKLLEMVDYEECREALFNLQKVLEILSEYSMTRYISVDLGMLQSINYYSGIIFKGFTYGLGFPLFSGGRYDQVVSAFGRDLAATGFSIGINFVMTALRRQGNETNSLDHIIRLIYEPVQRKEALLKASIWREKNLRVICESSADYKADFEQGSIKGTKTINLETLKLLASEKSVVVRIKEDNSIELLEDGGSI